ncbi:DUF397 domain-containing protein [Streptomyces sioyaensis]|uniref:DUF397 domain-containing protein n=1 Tax=Streptomyces sioyaensis TaxID=67364 RepID=UPI003409284D
MRSRAEASCSSSTVSARRATYPVPSLTRKHGFPSGLDHGSSRATGYSDANGGECVEFSPALTEAHGVAPVRDSKNPDGPALVFPAGGWSSFIAAVRGGEFSA